jgi:uncharacterized protein (TIGR03086 family)
MGEALRRDAEALNLLRADVGALSDGELSLPTPCTGWQVTDLLGHMAGEHERIVARMLRTPAAPDADVRQSFIVSADRWLEAFQRAGAAVFVPRLSREVATERVLAVHFVDMLVHRWDIARAVGRPCPVPASLAEAARPIAAESTAPGSPLVGAGRAYAPRVPGEFGAFDQVIALLGRDPAWAADADSS